MKKIISLKNRFLQLLALYVPGGGSFRVTLHRWRGVKIGKNVFIGSSAIIETEYPKLITIGNNVNIGIRCTIIGHTSDQSLKIDSPTVIIKDNVFTGAGVIILPNVTIGEGAVISAGSVVKTSVPPKTMVEGNPAKAVAICELPLTLNTSYTKFLANLRPIKKSN